jgi:hypothetical protein
VFGIIPKSIPKTTVGSRDAGVEARAQERRLGTPSVDRQGFRHREVPDDLKDVRGSAGAANDALRDLIDKQANVPEDGRKATVSSLLGRWLEECERLELSPTTIRSYRSQIDRRIRAELGSMQLTSLTARHLDALYGRMKLQDLSPKTIRMALDEFGVLLLREHRARTLAWVGEAGGSMEADAFVFSPELDGSRPFRPDAITGFFTGVRDECGLGTVRLHDLRHFTATQLIGANVDNRTVAGRLGHSNPSVTLRVYSHVLEERDQAAASILAIFSNPPPH